jgi:hypothetical protein
VAQFILELAALRKMTATAFGSLMALEPAAAQRHGRRDHLLLETGPLSIAPPPEQPHRDPDEESEQ